MFETRSEQPLEASVGWMTDLLLGSIAVALCVLAVAVVGLMMFSGRLPIRRGLQVVLGSFVLLGAPLIAGGFTGWWEENREPAPPPVTVSTDAARPDLPQAQYDPYAGASLRRD